MNPTCPRTQSFTSSIVKPVPGDGHNTEHAKEQRSVAAIPTHTPSKAHVTGEKHSDHHQYRHRRAAMDLHRPRFCAQLEIAGLRNEIIPVCPCRSSKKKQRDHVVEKTSLETLQSNWVRSGVSHDELNLQDVI